MKAVITVIGKDRVGIIAEIANLIAKNNSNIMNVEQTLMEDNFTMMMQVSFEEEKDFLKLNKDFKANEKKLRLSIKMYNAALFDKMYSI